VSLPARLLGTNPSIQVSALLSGTLTTPSAKGAFLDTSFESIATTTVGSGGAASVTFSSIPATYAHLQIRGISRNNKSGETETTLFARFNSDSNSNYAYHRLIGDGSSASALAAISDNAVYFYAAAAGASSGANIFGVSIWDILDYKSTTKNKTIRFLNGLDNNGSGRVTIMSGLWMNNTTAISSITIGSDGNHNFEQYSHFALYGIKGA